MSEFNVGDTGYYMTNTGGIGASPNIYSFRVIGTVRYRMLEVVIHKTNSRQFIDISYCYHTLQEACDVVVAHTRRHIEVSYQKLVKLQETYGVKI